MPVFQIQDLIDRAAAISDMHDNFVTSKQWLAWYNVERRALQISLARQGAAMQDMVLTVVPATDLYTLTGEFLAVVGVWEITSSQKLRPIKIDSFPDNFWQQTGGPVTGPAQLVTIEDTSTTTQNTMNFRFYPRPVSNNYLIVTSAAPPVAAAVTDTTSLPMGIEERIVVGMAKRALIKEESDLSAIMTLIREQDALVEEYCWSRALAQSPKVRNSDRLDRGWITDMLYPNPDLWTWI